MTKEEAKKWSELFAAVAEGKELQWHSPIADNGYWITLSNSEIDELISQDTGIYRIKPETKYVPFTRDDWKKFMMKKVFFAESHVDSGYKKLKAYEVIGVKGEMIGFEDEIGGWIWVPFKETFERFTFSDGTPFGKLVEE